MRMKKRITTLIAVAGLAVAAVVAWRLQNPPTSAAAAGGKTAGAPTAKGGAAQGPLTVEVGRVERMRLVDAAEAVGTLRALRSVELRPEVSGRVAQIGFIEGRPVKKGQLLVQLDDSLPRAQLAQARAQAGIAATQLQRNRDLLAQAFISQNAVDQAAAALQVAQAQVALAEAQLARMAIVAPFDAMTGVRRVSLGDYVKDGAELVSLQDMSQVWVDFRLPERYLARLRGGQEVEVSLDAFGERRFKARIETLDAQLDTEGRSLLVRARLLERDGRLKPGMFARTTIVLSTREQALVVPEEALVPQGGKQHLILVVDGPKGPSASRIEAKIGSRLDGKVEIVEGVEAGDLVVTAGQERLMRGNGQALKIVQIGKSGVTAASAPGGGKPAPAAASGAATRAP